MSNDTRKDYINSVDIPVEVETDPEYMAARQEQAINEAQDTMGGGNKCVCGGRINWMHQGVNGSTGNCTQCGKSFPGDDDPEQLAKITANPAGFTKQNG